MGQRLYGSMATTNLVDDLRIALQDLRNMQLSGGLVQLQELEKSILGGFILEVERLLNEHESAFPVAANVRPST